MTRWTDLATWVGHTINEGDGDGTPLEAGDRLSDVRGLVLHIASGFYAGTIAWQRNASADVSSHFIVGRDGRCAQMVDTADRSWAQRSGNSTWLSVELEGFAPDDPLHAQHPGWERLTDAQIEVCARLFARAHQVYGAAKVPLQIATSPTGRGLGHHSMGAESGYDWGHSQCPGVAIKSQKPAILARSVAIVSGAPATIGDNDMDSNQAAKLDAMFNLYPEVRLDTDGTPDGKGTSQVFPVPLTAFLKKLAEKVDAPAPVQLSDAQLDVLAGKVATKLSALRFVPTV